jgi:hypothetical protein
VKIAMTFAREKLWLAAGEIAAAAGFAGPRAPALPAVLTEQIVSPAMLSPDNIFAKR